MVFSRNAKEIVKKSVPEWRKPIKNTNFASINKWTILFCATKRKRLSATHIIPNHSLLLNNQPALKYYRYRTPIVVLSAIVILMLTRLLPTITIGDYTLKTADLFSDLSGYQDGDDALAALADSAEVKPERPVPDGLTPILDYGKDEGTGLAPLCEALKGIKTMDRPVRIAVLGDSFIEGDIFVSDLRQMLQAKFGGGGVGFVDMAAVASGFRRSVRHTHRGWIDHCILKPRGTGEPYGLNQHYFRADSAGAWTELAVVGHSRRDTVCRTQLIVRSTYPTNARLTVNQDQTYNLRSSGTGHFEAITYDGTIGRARWAVNGGTCYGIVMEEPKGVSVDCYSLRGSSGMTLRSITADLLSEFAAVRQYDLIILQYGLNVADNKRKDYSAYISNMVTVVEHLRSAFPEAGILIMGIGDRSGRLPDGSIGTLEGVKYLASAQQQLAQQTHSAYWNTLAAMKTIGGIKAMAEKKPAEANKDYTHITHLGGKSVARLLYDALLWEMELE